jgi:uncharacterized Zn-binding protein involved in type VI secretion
MPSQSRVGDNDTGHGSFPPTTITAGSGDVITNGKSSARKGDPLEAHGSPSPSPSHGRSISAGSGSVMINGIPAARINDPINCGGTLAAGSGDVIVG